MLVACIPLYIAVVIADCMDGVSAHAMLYWFVPGLIPTNIGDVKVTLGDAFDFDKLQSIEYC